MRFGRSRWAWLAVAGLVLQGGGLQGKEISPRAVFQELPLKRAEIADDFFARRREVFRGVTLPAQWEQFELHHHLHNFRALAGEEPGAHLGAVFLDSDLYKWMEAASYVAGKHPEAHEIAERLKEAIELVRKVQMPDGYLNTYYQAFAAEQRWRILFLNHELYCAGHLLEAAAARFEATGSEDLLEPARKLADHIVSEFGPGRNEGVPGHEEIELALVRLYRVTGERSYLELARYFVEQRGRNPRWRREFIQDLVEQSKLSREVAKKRAGYIEEKDGEASTSYGFAKIPVKVLPRAFFNFWSGRYFQVHKPLVEQEAAEGHAVRAMYFYTGAADVYLEVGGDELIEALSRIWERTISRRTYITGGMGSLPLIEGFGRDYELPNRAYSETCAAIGSFFFSWRMLRASGQAKYADQMERTLYNAILAGISLDGRRYFYRNPLTARGDVERKEWYVVACCPPNIARLLGSLERYIYGESDDAIWVHQFIGGRGDFRIRGARVKARMESGMPWQGRAALTLEPERPLEFTLKIRRPVWAEEFRVKVNGEPAAGKSTPGSYVELFRKWRKGDRVELDFPLRPRLVAAPQKDKENRGKVAIHYGPLVFCVEDKDNPGLDVHSLVMAEDAELEPVWRPDLLGGVMIIRSRTEDGKALVAIPYYAWANRGPSHMEVWIRRH